MLAVGPATKIIIHVNEDTSSRRDFLHSEILTFLYERGVSGATVVKPHAGFGSRHRVHTAGAGFVEVAQPLGEGPNQRQRHRHSAADSNIDFRFSDARVSAQHDRGGHRAVCHADDS